MACFLNDNPNCHSSFFAVFQCKTRVACLFAHLRICKTVHHPTAADDEEVAQQAALLALTAQTIALQAPPDHAETQQYWMTRAMEAYRRVPDRYEKILGIGLAIEALHLQ